jgi:hypothetical protein
MNLHIMLNLFLQQLVSDTIFTVVGENLYTWWPLEVLGKGIRRVAVVVHKEACIGTIFPSGNIL